MAFPVQPSSSKSSIFPTSDQIPQQKQQLFEIQFETAVLSVYVSITNQNGSTQQQLSKLKNGLAAGTPPDQLATDLNLIVDQINTNIIPGKAKFPPFRFSTQGNQPQASSYFALTLEKFLHTAAEEGALHRHDKDKLFSDLSDVINYGNQITPEQSLIKINGVIDAANNILPAQYKIPPLTGGRS